MSLLIGFPRWLFFLCSVSITFGKVIFDHDKQSEQSNLPSNRGSVLCDSSSEKCCKSGSCISTSTIYFFGGFGFVVFTGLIVTCVCIKSRTKVTPAEDESGVRRCVAFPPLPSVVNDFPVESNDRPPTYNASVMGRKKLISQAQMVAKTVHEDYCASPFSKQVREVYCSSPYSKQVREDYCASPFSEQVHEDYDTRSFWEEVQADYCASPSSEQSVKIIVQVPIRNKSMKIIVQVTFRNKSLKIMIHGLFGKKSMKIIVQVPLRNKSMKIMIHGLFGKKSRQIIVQVPFRNKSVKIIVQVPIRNKSMKIIVQV
ncbi:unnamed protein product, partial [Tenebrio molitor]